MDILTSESVRRERRDGSVVTMDKLTPSEWPIYNPPPQPTEPSTLSKISTFMRRAFRADGSGGTVGLPEATRPAAPSHTFYTAEYRLASGRLVHLQQRIAAFHEQMRVHHAAPGALEAARTALRTAEDADVTAAGEAVFKGTGDPDAQARARTIEDAKAAVAQAQRAAGVAAKAIQAGDAAMAPLVAEIKSIESQMPLMIRNALREQLAEFAPVYGKVREQFMAAQVHAFAIAKIIDDLTRQTGGDSHGAGLIRDLRLPHPEHPAYRDMNLPADLLRQVAQEAQRVLTELDR
jgi:hypothetical protein